MSDATQQGAEVASVEDRIEALLSVEPTETTEESSQEEEVIQSEGVEGPQDEPEEGDEPEADDDATSEEADEEDAVEQVELEADELASLLGIDVEALSIGEDGAIKLKTKIDGEPGEATLADLVKSYQLEGHVNKKSMELAESRKAFEAQREQASAVLAERLTQADQLMTSLESELLNSFNSIDWAGLRDSDPAEYAAKQQDYGAQYQRIQQMKEQAMQVVMQQRQEAEQIGKQHQAELLQREYQATLDAIPEWRDEKTANAEKSAMMGLLKDYGFSADEISQLADHRTLLVIRDAMRYRQGSQKVETAKKKVKRVPKVQKPGAAKSKSAIASEKQAQLKKRVKSGDSDALLTLLEGRV